jgi:hypothetical protein
MHWARALLHFDARPVLLPVAGRFPATLAGAAIWLMEAVPTLATMAHLGAEGSHLQGIVVSKFRIVFKKGASSLAVDCLNPMTLCCIFLEYNVLSCRRPANRGMVMKVLRS